jgi:transcriptional regulator with XRE-family HTH domain
MIKSLPIRQKIKGGIHMNSSHLKQLREEIGMTKTELSRITGISIGYLCHLERGTRKNPSMEMMCKIANGLDRTVAEVFFVL